jgi:hypothetical protein
VFQAGKKTKKLNHSVVSFKNETDFNDEEFLKEKVSIKVSRNTENILE